MSIEEKDEFDAQAEQLLKPYLQNVVLEYAPPKLVFAVAAALRAAGKPCCEAGICNKALDLELELADLRDERDGLKAKLEKQAWINDAVYQGMVKENDELKARLAKATELMAEVHEWHADPDSPEYNGCEDQPCEWCTEAKMIRAELDKKP